MMDDQNNPICPRDNGITDIYRSFAIYDEQSMEYTTLELWQCSVCGTLIGRFVEK